MLFLALEILRREGESTVFLDGSETRKRGTCLALSNGVGLVALFQ